MWWCQSLHHFLPSFFFSFPTPMASTEIIPIIQHPFSSSSPTISATVDTMLIKEYGNKDGNQHPFFLQLTSQATAAANFKRQRRWRVSRESILPGHNVGHAVAVTFLAVRLCFRVLRCLWYVLRFCHSFRIYKECLQLCRLQLLRSYNFVILIWYCKGVYVFGWCFMLHSVLEICWNALNKENLSQRLKLKLYSCLSYLRYL